MFELKECVCLHAEDILSAAMCARSDNIMYKWKITICVIIGIYLDSTYLSKFFN